MPPPINSLVTDAASIDAGEKVVLVLPDQLVETNASRLLHSFKAELEVDGQVLSQLLVRLNDVDPAQNGTLVVGAASAVQSAGLFIRHQLERLAIPAVGLECWLHIKVLQSMERLVNERAAYHSCFRRSLTPYTRIVFFLSESVFAL